MEQFNAPTQTTKQIASYNLEFNFNKFLEKETEDSFSILYVEETDLTAFKDSILQDISEKLAEYLDDEYIGDEEFDDYMPDRFLVAQQLLAYLSSEDSYKESLKHLQDQVIEFDKKFPSYTEPGYHLYHNIEWLDYQKALNYVEDNL